MAPARIGTIGFTCREMLGSVYPSDASRDDYLRHYARRLSAVEINPAFHRLPALSTVENWLSFVPAGFRISLSATRHLAHDWRHHRGGKMVSSLQRLTRALGEQAGPVLLQIPAVFQLDIGALEHFLHSLGGMRVALEFKHPSWHTDNCLRVLSEYSAAWVVTDDGLGRPRGEVTSDFAYWRLRSDHSESEWQAWAERAAYLAARGIELYAYVKQERPGRALWLTRRVNELLGHVAAPETDSFHARVLM